MGDILAIQVTAAALRAVRLAGIGPGRAIRAYAERPLPQGAVVPSSSVPNIHDEGAFARALLDAAGARPPRRARLVLPDRSVHFHLITADAIPPAGPDLRRFLVWRLQDALPFEPREARMAYLPAPNGPPGRQVALTLVARELVLAQYERLLVAAGIVPAHMAPAACHLFNLAAQAAEATGTLLEAFLALGPESATLILTRQGVPAYARTFVRPGAEGQPPRTDPDRPAAPQGPHQRLARHKELVAEILHSFEHAEQETGLDPPARLCLGGELGDDATLAAALQEGLGIPCPLLSPAFQRVRGARRLPSEAHAVLSAALAQA